MRKRVTGILAFIFLLYGCSTKQVRQNDRERMNLSGPVRSVSEISFEAVDLFGLIAKGDRKRENYTESDFAVVFNETGFITEETTFSSDGNIDKKSVYKYDGKENLLQKENYDASGNLVGSLNAKYNRKGLKTSEVFVDHSGNAVYNINFRYNNKNNLLEENKTNPNGKRISRILFSYKEKAILSEENTFDTNENPALKIVTVNDSLGMDKKVYDPQGNLGGRDFYKYGQGQRLVEKSQYSADGSLYAKWTCTYEEDSVGNWIKRIDYLNDKPKYRIERKIEYYPNAEEKKM